MAFSKLWENNNEQGERKRDIYRVPEYLSNNIPTVQTKHVRLTYG